jgi:hypothetical protein
LIVSWHKQLKIVVKKLIHVRIKVLIIRRHDAERVSRFYEVF